MGWPVRLRHSPRFRPEHGGERATNREQIGDQRVTVVKPKVKNSTGHIGSALRVEG